jgi:hypothetical protein
LPDAAMFKLDHVRRLLEEKGINEKINDKSKLKNKQENKRTILLLL